jgi:predicted nucleotidyltransferase
VAPDRFARDATSDDLRRVIRALNEAGAEYLLIGGYALAAWGHQRATRDIDILVRPTRDTGERVKRALLVLPDRAAADLDPAWFEESDTIRVADEIVVDVMFNACGETYESLKVFERTLDLGDGTVVRTVDLEGLLKTKQTTRNKNDDDRIFIETALRLRNETEGSKG